MVDKKTATIVIVLLAFAVMYSTFVTESSTTGKYTASKYATSENPTNPIPKVYGYTSNTPFGGDETYRFCNDPDGDDIYTKGITNYGETKVKDRCINPGLLNEYVCSEDEDSIMAIPIKCNCFDGACR